ncbi:MAG: MBL fold metallo-hydrolase [Rhizobium sp.]|nr:MBL fold metallo-hydrolase [Rhizobium sp.]
MLINRRSLLLTGAAAGLGAALSTTAFAAAPLSGVQAPGFYRRKVGSLEITALLDGYAPLSVDNFSGTDKADLVGILKQAGLSESLPTSVNAFVINSGDKTYLVDTGIGANQMFGPTLGNTIANLKAAGITPDQIDAVILTHTHPDHADGLISAEGAALFPNAELVLHEKEAGFWLDDGALSKAPDGLKPMFDLARKALKPYEARTRLAKDGEIFPGIEMMLSAGHTPGHSILRVASGADQLLIVGDTVHNAAIHAVKPDTAFAFDMDPAEAAANRRRIFDMVSADNMLIAATHIAFPSFGRIFVDGDHYRFQPADYAYTL